MQDKHINIRIDKETDQKVKQIAEKNGIKRSEQYRRIIHQYFVMLSSINTFES